MTTTVIPHLLLSRGDQRSDAFRICENYSNRFGAKAADALFSATVNDHGDTCVIAFSKELRDFFIRQPGWIDWYGGEDYPLSEG